MVCVCILKFEVELNLIPIRFVIFAANFQLLTSLLMLHLYKPVKGGLVKMSNEVFFLKQHKFY